MGIYAGYWHRSKSPCIHIGMTITLPKGNAPAKSGNGKLTVDKSQSNDNHASDVNAKANGPKAK